MPRKLKVKIKKLGPVRLNKGPKKKDTKPTKTLARKKAVRKKLAKT